MALLATMSSEPRPSTALSCRQLHQRRQGTVVLRGVDLDLPPGSVTALLGANGAGKSTLMMTLAGLLPLARGAVRVGEHQLKEAPERALANLMFVPQRPPLEPTLSIREHAEALSALRNLETTQATQTLERCAERLGLHLALDRPIAALSGGMQQKGALCLGLIAQTDVLLLDEPYAGLDIPSAAALRQLLRARRDEGAALLVASHSAEATLDIADRAVVLNSGRISLTLDSSHLAAFGGDARQLEGRLLEAMGSGDVAARPPEDQ